MSFITQTPSKNQAVPLNFLEIIASIDQPRFHNKDTGWQVASIKPVKVEGIEISAITGNTPLTLSRFMRVKVRGFVKVKFGKYQIDFIKCEEVEAEYRNPIMTVLSRAGVSKARCEVMRIELGEDFASKIASDPSHIQRMFPKIKKPGQDAIRVSCEKVAAGNAVFQALNAVGAPQETINAASAFDLAKQDIYDLLARDLPFSKADALAQHPDIQKLQPFDRHSPSRIAHAALVQVKEYCGLWGHTGLPITDVLTWLGKTYGLDEQVCRDALVLSADKRGLHIDDGPNKFIYLKNHYEAERAIFRLVRKLAEARTERRGKIALAKSARIMVGTSDERIITFTPIQQESLAGLIAHKLAILTGGPGSGKSTLITALNDHYEDLLVTAVAAKAALRAHEISGARHTSIFGIIGVPGGCDRWLSGVRVLVIEEASMVGSIQMAKLVSAALQYGVQKIVLCGDPNQIAPIENGAPFLDLIRSGIIPIFRLTENHRTDLASLGIAEFCHEILEGQAK